VIGCCKRYKHHFIVRVVELKELAAHLCVIYSRMTQMLAATTSGNYDGACTQHNTLSPSAYLSYSATPESLTNLIRLGRRKKRRLDIK
jgi:hypothetical protein